MSAVNQLSGWQHAQNYIHNPQLYVERLKSAQRGEEMSRGPIVPGSIDDYQFRGQMIIKRLCQRIQWLLDLQIKSNKSFDAELAVKVIAADRVWASDANVFMKEAESKVTDMLTRNQQKFQAFRELQRKGVQWMHSPELRRDIEAAGFVYRPMMIKRDRCVCETCGVEVSGWREWYSEFPSRSRLWMSKRIVVFLGTIHGRFIITVNTRYAQLPSSLLNSSLIPFVM